jgi:hypothetical protein
MRCQQIAWFATFDDAALIEQKDTIKVEDSVQVVSNSNDGRSAELVANNALDKVVSGNVEPVYKSVKDSTVAGTGQRKHDDRGKSARGAMHKLWARNPIGMTLHVGEAFRMGRYRKTPLET